MDYLGWSITYWPESRGIALILVEPREIHYFFFFVLKWRDPLLLLFILYMNSFIS